MYALLLVYTTLLSITTEILTFFARPVNTGMSDNLIILPLYDSEARIVPAWYDNLWHVYNCFHTHTLEWLSKRLLSENENWHRNHECLEHRLQLAPDSASSKRLHNMCVKITESIEKVVDRPLSPIGTKLWLDLPGFQCPYHADSDMILVTYQVYLWGHGGGVPGTSFCQTPAIRQGQSPEIEIPFEPNTGYINLNIDQKVHHARNCDGIRLSVCFQWQAA